MEAKKQDNGYPENPVTRVITASQIDTFGKLGKRVEIGANAKVTVNKPGLRVEYFCPTVDVLIGIGKDHVANLIMDADAWEALKSGEEINIDSLKDFKKKFL